MDATLIKALQLILSLSILVVLHEGGHFFFSKLFGVKVEKFFLFFDPYFHLFSTKDKWVTRLFPRLKKNETEYGVGWLPFGGYVKISGMIDESMDTEQMSKPVQSYEFRAKPAWQRLFIMIGGVLVNFLLALVIYSMVLFAWGEQYMPMKNMTMSLPRQTKSRMANSMVTESLPVLLVKRSWFQKKTSTMPTSLHVRLSLLRQPAFHSWKTMTVHELSWVPTCSVRQFRFSTRTAHMSEQVWNMPLPVTPVQPVLQQLQVPLPMLMRLR